MLHHIAKILAQMLPFEHVIVKPVKIYEKKLQYKSEKKRNPLNTVLCLIVLHYSSAR